ncbi:hypothetical protein CKA32_003817 [Geitlerinema sp. FC II]|nr:hypothetical protein CKA32_003817 [Geitlerinema sp. FC II]
MADLETFRYAKIVLSRSVDLERTVRRSKTALYLTSLSSETLSCDI